MARVQLTQALIGSPVRQAGEFLELDDDTAKKFIARGIAIPAPVKKQTTESKKVTEKRAVSGKRSSGRRTNNPKRS